MFLSPSDPGPEQPRPRTRAPSSAVAAPGHATDVCLPWMRPVFGLSAATLSTSRLLSAGAPFEENSRGHRTFDIFKSSTMTSPSSYSTVCCSCKHGEYAYTHMCTITNMSMIQPHGTRNTLSVLASKRVRMPPNHCSSPSHHTSILLPTTSCPNVLLPIGTSSCVTRARAVLPLPPNPVPQLPRVGSPSSTSSSSASRVNLFCLPPPLHAPTPCTRGRPRQPSCTPRPPAELSPESLPARREGMHTQFFSPHKSRFSARACSLSCMLFCDMNEDDTSTTGLVLLTPPASISCASSHASVHCARRAGLLHLPGGGKKNVGRQTGQNHDKSKHDGISKALSSAPWRTVLVSDPQCALQTTASASSIAASLPAVRRPASPRRHLRIYTSHSVLSLCMSSVLQGIRRKSNEQVAQSPRISKPANAAARQRASTSLSRGARA